MPGVSDFREWLIVDCKIDGATERAQDSYLLRLVVVDDNIWEVQPPRSRIDICSIVPTQNCIESELVYIEGLK